MATEQLQENANWRAIQKERERERRRVRDRQRRQSMSVEEREKHLARRRKNYQLRRQRAVNAQSGIERVQISNETLAEPSIRKDSLALVCISEPSMQSHCEMEVGIGEAYDKQNTSAVKYDSERTFPGAYNYPRVPKLTEIRHLARLLNSSAENPCVGNQGIEAEAISGEMVTSHCTPRRGIRLIHIKHLARALNSTMGKSSEQNNLFNLLGVGNDGHTEIEMTSREAFWNRQSKEALDEDQQFHADNS